MLSKLKIYCTLTLFYLLFHATTSVQAKEYKYNIAICAIFQNEAPYLKEWIEFHKLVGVKHFYLYSNLSTDNYQNVLQPYINKGQVELIEWPYNTNADGGNWSTIQTQAYNHAINIATPYVKWLIILDTDEFLFPVKESNLSKFLTNFEDVAALSVNWQMYGTSNVEKILPGHLLIEDLIYKAPTHYSENSHVKTIVRPEFVESCQNPHYCFMKPGYFQVNSLKHPIDGPSSPVNINTIRINHYWTRDLNFFYNHKLPRRQKWQDGGCLVRAQNINKNIDTAIYKYVLKLKQKLFIKKNLLLPEIVSD